jgi:hypothetical protein
MALILYPLSVWQCNDLPKAYLPLYQPGTVSAQCGLVRNLSSIQPSWLVITGNNADCRQLEKPGLKLHYASPAEAGERVCKQVMPPTKKISQNKIYTRYVCFIPAHFLSLN